MHNCHYNSRSGGGGQASREQRYDAARIHGCNRARASGGDFRGIRRGRGTGPGVSRGRVQPPWFRVEKIKTPTLIMCGTDDMNVPLINSEQLFLALKRLGRETELVIYPGQTHVFTRPSYRVDRYRRYLAWYDRFLKS